MLPEITVNEIRVTWFTEAHTVKYQVWSVASDDQLAWVGEFDQGPFDTALEVAQWLWRTIAKVVPPAAC